MRRRIILSLLLMTLLSSVFSLLIAAAALPGAAARRVQTTLGQEAALLEHKAPEGHITEAFLQERISLSRLTWIAADGEVLFDSQEDHARMDNHLDRPEVQQALAQGTGVSRRHSDTQREDNIYYAKRLPDGSVLRASAPVTVGPVLMRDLLPWLLLGLAVALVLSLLIARDITARFTRRIAEVDLDRPEEAETYSELSPMLGRIHQQNQAAQQQVSALQRQQEEMNTLLNSMHEGFVVLDEHRRVQRINRSAATLLGVPMESAVGRSISELYRRAELFPFLDQLEQDGEAQANLPWDLKSYQWSASLLPGSKTAVVLLRDVTQHVEGEAMRRRFTANVSHELRTPLTAICGYSEMLLSGMVKKEDQADFIGRIDAESKRLLKLIEDILELSRMDEGYPGGRNKRLTLLDVCKDVVKTLKPVAEKKDVHISLGGDKAEVVGDPTLLSELVTNLVDNAIKYNRPGGKVDIRVSSDKEFVTLLVEDTGIGIERSQQDKVFERFYRTDNSRSKETGGTGLGLSIVKHSAEYHKASLEVDSQQGIGTRIAVKFPVPEKKKKKK